MIKRGDLTQNLDQVLGAELTGSAAGRDELCQAHLAHHVSFRTRVADQREGPAPGLALRGT